MSSMQGKPITIILINLFCKARRYTYRRETAVPQTPSRKSAEKEKECKEASLITSQE